MIYQSRHELNGKTEFVKSYDGVRTDRGENFQAKVAHYMYNCPEYLEGTLASWLGGYVPFNVNYRYGPEEVFYLFDNADAEAVIFHGAFAGLIDQVRGRLPLVKRWYMVPDAENSAVPAWAQAPRRAARRRRRRPPRPALTRRTRAGWAWRRWWPCPRRTAASPTSS